MVFNVVVDADVNASAGIAYSKLGTIPTWNQSTTGSAATLTNGRTIAMTGDVVWNSGAFNGGGDITATATIQSGSIEPAMIESTNTPAGGLDGYVLSYNHGTGSHTWVAQSSGQLTTEQVQDIVGEQLFTNGSHTGITVSYDDSNDGAIDLAVGTLNQDTTGTADHVTVTNNASVNESNRITFVEDAAGAGSRGLESDAAFHLSKNFYDASALAPSRILHDFFLP